MTFNSGHDHLVICRGSGYRINTWTENGFWKPQRKILASSFIKSNELLSMEVSSTNFNSRNNNEETDIVSRLRNGRTQHSQRTRLMSQQGHVQIQYVNIPGERHLYLTDYFTTVIEWQWKYVLLLFSFSFISSWLVFGSIWWGIFFNRREHFNVTCIENINGWTAAFLFSLETQTTIGYGGRQISSDCPEGTILLLIQCIVGLVINSTMVGLVFSKLQRPHLRSSTILFSNTAVIAPRDGKMCLMFRVGDVRKSQLLKPHVQVLFLKKLLKTKEAIVSQRNLRVTYNTNETQPSDSLYFFVPLIICHVIDETSPLYHITQEKLQQEECEIVVILEAIVEPTGNVVQARTSYIPKQIKWGHVFSKMTVEENSSRNENHTINFSKFNSIEPVISLQRIEHDRNTAPLPGDN